MTRQRGLDRNICQHLRVPRRGQAGRHNAARTSLREIEGLTADRGCGCI